MKRSEINKIIKDSLALAESLNFKLPPFMYFSPDDWKEKQNEYKELKDNMLGWDITDFGSGDFAKQGLVMLVLRNGNQKSKEVYKKPYAEKLLVSFDNQLTPTHFHWSKMEDIINRGGGNLITCVWNSDENENKLDTPVEISIDGRRCTVEAGQEICLKPGESVTIEPKVYHCFWAEKGTGAVLLGEVSSVNDDTIDNNFYDKQPRFPDIDEDEPADHLLITEY